MPAVIDGDGATNTMSRRDLIDMLGKLGAGALAGAMSGGLTTMTGAMPAAASSGGSSADVGVKRKFRYGMVIDTRRCVGC
ncbi:MAG: hypothetical protein WEB67_13235, partial [Acidimicrobiia bacterium]